MMIKFTFEYSLGVNFQSLNVVRIVIKWSSLNVKMADIPSVNFTSECFVNFTTFQIIKRSLSTVPLSKNCELKSSSPY